MFKKSSLFSVLKKLVGRWTSEKYVIAASLSFYFLLWFTNPSRKIIAAAFVLLIFVFYYKIKDIKISVFLTYIVSSIIFTGKSYLVQLVPEGIFPQILAPQGYVDFMTISYYHIIAFVMFLFLLRHAYEKKFKLKFEKKDILITIYFFWLVISDILGSTRPEVSLFFSLTSLHFLVLYFYVKFFVISKKEYASLLVAIFISQVIFESAISFQQLVINSPVFKNIEAQVDIEYFGFTSDELQFRFRPVGTFGHANNLGSAMSFWLVCLISYLYKKNNYLVFIVLIAGVATLASTLSRSSWLGFGSGLLFLLYFMEKVKRIKTPSVISKNFLVIALMILILAFLFVFPRAEKSLFGISGGGGYFRVEQIRATLELIKQNVFFGVGSQMSVPAALLQVPGSIYSYVPLGVHNWYFLITAEHGVAALIIFIALLFTFLVFGIKRIWKANMESTVSPLQIGLFSGALSLLVIAIFQPFVGETFMILTFAILGGENGKN